MDNHEKENALNIVTEERTYHIYAESPEDARYIKSAHSADLTGTFLLGHHFRSDVWK